MLTIYFCVDGHDPVIRCWSSIPRIGETVALTELEDVGETFKVADVVWEGDGEPTLSIYLKRSEGFLRRILKTSNTSTPCNSGLSE
jgi:hypothetical protein